MNRKRVRGVHFHFFAYRDNTPRALVGVLHKKFAGKYRGGQSCCNDQIRVSSLLPIGYPFTNIKVYMSCSFRRDHGLMAFHSLSAKLTHLIFPPMAQKGFPGLTSRNIRMADHAYTEFSISRASASS